MAASAGSIRAGRAFVELFADDSKLAKGLKSAQAKIKAFGEAIAGVGKKLTAIGAAITAPLIGFAKLFASNGDAIAKASRRLGMGTNALSELSYAAMLSGTDLETLEIGLRRMQRTLGEAALGSKSATEALARLGLSVADLRGLSPDQQFALLAERLSQVHSQSLRTAIAMQIFGRGGTALLPMIEKGAGGLATMREEARRLGFSMSQETALKAEKLTDALATMWKALKGIGSALGAAIAPLLTEWATKITEVAVQVKNWIKDNKQLIVLIFKAALAVQGAGMALVLLGYAIKMAAGALGILRSAVAGVHSVLSTLTSVVTGLFGLLPLLLNPWVLLGVAIAAAVAALLYFTGALQQMWTAAKEVFGGLWEDAKLAFQGIADALLAGDITLAGEILWASLKVVWQRGVNALMAVWLSFKAGFLSVTYSAFYGVLELWETVQHGLTIAWIETAAFLQNLWGKLRGAFDETFDVQANAAAIEADRQRQRDLERQEYQANYQALTDRANQADTELTNQLQKDLETNEAKLAELKKARDALVAKAAGARAAGKPEEVASPADYLSSDHAHQDWINQILAGKATTRGTFNAVEAAGMYAGGTAERIAKAAEKTAKNTDDIARELKELDQEFD